MKALFLSDWGSSLRTRGLELEVFNREQGTSERYSTKTLTFDTVIANHLGGFVTWPALRWLSLNGVTLMLLDFNGKPLYTALPDCPLNGPRRLAQYRAFVERRLEIAKWIVEAKTGAKLPDNIRDLDHLRGIESKYAEGQFEAVGIRRDHYKATDGINALYNYSAGVLEGRARLAVHALGLEPSLGYLHEPRNYGSALVYDAMEVHRTQALSFALAVKEETGPADFYLNHSRGVCLKPKAARAVVHKFETEFDDREAIRFVEQLCLKIEGKRTLGWGESGHRATVRLLGHGLGANHATLTRAGT